MTAPALILPSPDIGAGFKHWGLAAAFVCVAHLGLMAGYLLLPAPQPEGAASAPTVIIELAPIPVAPASPNDIAPGPEMLEAQPTPKQPVQTEPEVVETTPKLEAPAEVTLPRLEPKADEKTSEDNPAAQKTDTKPVERIEPAPRTTAAPRSEQRTAHRPAAPSPGSEASRAAIMSWRDQVVARLQSVKRSPHQAQARREQGFAMLNFTVDRNGRVLTRRIAKSSGSMALDEEVLALVLRAQPLPAFPPAMDQSVMHLTVPIRFGFQ
ncbi:MAG: TonB family protein [Methyloceanibacter sp.]